MLNAEADGVVLLTQTVDEEFMALAMHVLELGVGEEKEIAVKEWERPGTKLRFESRTLMAEDVEDENQVWDKHVLGGIKECASIPVGA